MPIPTQIKIGPHVYAVVLKAKSQMPREAGELLDGQCDFDRLQILLRVGLCRSKKKEYLLHEILHACTYPSLNGKTMDDETFVDSTAPVLLQVLQDNPELVAYLTN